MGFVKQFAKRDQVAATHCRNGFFHAIALVHHMFRTISYRLRQARFVSFKLLGSYFRQATYVKALFQQTQSLFRFRTTFVVLAGNQAVRLVAVGDDKGVVAEFERYVLVRYRGAIQQNGVVRLAVCRNVLIHYAAIDVGVFALGTLGKQCNFLGVDLLARNGSKRRKGGNLDCRGTTQSATERHGAVLQHVATDNLVSRLLPNVGATGLVVAQGQVVVLAKFVDVDCHLVGQRCPRNIDFVCAVCTHVHGVFQRQRRRENLATAVVDVFTDDVDAPRRRHFVVEIIFFQNRFPPKRQLFVLLA